MNSKKNELGAFGTSRIKTFGKDFWSGLVFLVISLLLYFVIIPGEVEGEIQRGLAPTFFPNFAAAWIGFFGIFLLTNELVSNRASSPSKESKMQLRQDLKGAVCAMVISIFYIIVCSIVGYLISTVLFLAVFCWILGERRWRMIVVATLATTFGIYFLFGMVMRLRLPEGILLGS